MWKIIKGIIFAEKNNFEEIKIAHTQLHNFIYNYLICIILHNYA